MCTRWLTCGTCGKEIRNKPVLGTLHFCLSEEEILAKRRAIQLARWQIAAQKSYVRGGSPYDNLGWLDIAMTAPATAKDENLT